MAITKRKIKRRLSAGINMPCKVCKTPVPNTDSEAFAVTCHKCVSRLLNPHTIFIDDLPQEEWVGLIKKLYARD